MLEEAINSKSKKDKKTFEMVHKSELARLN